MEQNIKMQRGRTLAFSVDLHDRYGNSASLNSGDILRFAIKNKSGDIVYETTSTTKSFSMHPSDTNDLPVGTYFYDIGLQRGNEYYTVVEKSMFRIDDNVTSYKAVTST